MHDEPFYDFFEYRDLEQSEGPPCVLCNGHGRTRPIADLQPQKGTFGPKRFSGAVFCDDCYGMIGRAFWQAGDEPPDNDLPQLNAEALDRVLNSFGDACEQLTPAAVLPAIWRVSVMNWLKGDSWVSVGHRALAEVYPVPVGDTALLNWIRRQDPAVFDRNFRYYAPRRKSLRERFFPSHEPLQTKPGLEIELLPRRRADPGELIPDTSVIPLPYRGFDPHAHLGLALEQSGTWLFGIVAEASSDPEEVWSFAECLIIPGSGTAAAWLKKAYDQHILGLEVRKRGHPPRPEIDQSVLAPQVEEVVRRMVLFPPNRNDQISSYRDITYARVASKLGIGESTLRSYCANLDSPVEKPRVIAKRLFPNLELRAKR